MRRKERVQEIPSLETIWEKVQGDVEKFIEAATINNYSLLSIKDFLSAKGVKMTEEEIDKIRHPLLYISKSLK